LPATLQDVPDVQWHRPLSHSGLGGIAATHGFVVFGDRDTDDFHDVFRCLDAETGDTIWEVQRLAIAALDYGNSPRATPLIHDGRVFCQSAHGLLLCIDLRSGSVLWEKDLRTAFPPAGELPWGYCGSPLIVDGRLIVNPGAKNASLVALNPDDGKLLWKSPGAAPSYGSLLVGVFGGRRQIVGHDAVSLGGWEISSGERLWTVKPPASGDFNVPTPLMHDGRALVVTENNGARLFDFDDDGLVVPQPIASNRKLRPDMSSPVLVGGRIYCVNRFLYCLDLQDGLQESWRIRDPAFGDYAAVFASAERILVVGNGELLLLSTDGSQEILARQQIFDEKLPIYSHAALVGKRFYVRGESGMICIAL